MAQQINLHSPILLAPKRYFSALAMLQSLAALALGLAALCFWASLSTDRLRHELAATTQLHEADRRRLQAQLAARPALPADTAALEQELAAAKKALAERRHLRDELVAPPASARRYAVLQRLAQTAPASLWLTEVHLAEQRIELAGMTLQPEGLRPWLAALGAAPELAGLALRSVKVERREAIGGEAQAWSFRVVSGDTDTAAAPADTARTGGTP